VRFELDCEEGTIRCRVNDADQGIVFTGLQGLEVFPVVGRTCMQHLVYCVSAFLPTPFVPLETSLTTPRLCSHAHDLQSPCIPSHTYPLSPITRPRTQSLHSSAAPALVSFVLPWTGVHVR